MLLVDEVDIYDAPRFRYRCPPACCSMEGGRAGRQAGNEGKGSACTSQAACCLPLVGSGSRAHPSCILAVAIVCTGV